MRQHLLVKGLLEGTPLCQTPAGCRYSGCSGVFGSQLDNLQPSRSRWLSIRLWNIAQQLTTLGDLDQWRVTHDLMLT